MTPFVLLKLELLIINGSEGVFVRTYMELTEIA